MAKEMIEFQNIGDDVQMRLYFSLWPWGMKFALLWKIVTGKSIVFNLRRKNDGRTAN